MKKLIIGSLVFVSLAGSVVHAQHARVRPKAVLLDLGGIFFSFSKLGYAKKVGIPQILAYLVLDWKNPAKMQMVIFDVLNQVPLEKDPNLKPTCTTSGKILPYLVCSYQAGRITAKDALSMALETGKKLKKEGFFRCEREAELVKRSITLMFSPEVHAELTYKLTDGIGLLKELARMSSDEDKGYKLIGISNWDAESGALVKRKFAEEFALFDVVHFSGEMKTIKPNHDAFEYVLKRHNLRKEECVFLDDQPENREAAQEFGIQYPILYENAQQARQALVKLDLLLERLPTQGGNLKKVTTVVILAAILVVIYHAM